MRPRSIIFAVLVGGPLAGTMLGLAADPKMAALPEPAWRSAQPDAVFTRSQQWIDTGPQDLSPQWDGDRLPTWKRRAVARQIAMSSAPAPDDFAALPPVLPATLPAVADAAAADQAPVRDAQSAVPIITPAATEPDDAAELGG